MQNKRHSFLYSLPHLLSFAADRFYLFENKTLRFAIFYLYLHQNLNLDEAQSLLFGQHVNNFIGDACTDRLYIENQKPQFRIGYDRLDL